MSTNKTLNFGDAIEAIKRGKAVARDSWEWECASIYLNKGSFDADSLGVYMKVPAYPHSSTINGISIGLFVSGDNGTITRLPNINMKLADGSTVTGWLASQTDMLAEDWKIIEE